MPLYEYVCPTCKARFEKLQSMSAGKEAPCPGCGQTALRAISVFAAVSVDEGGSTASITGGGCAGCGGGSCGSCHTHAH